MRVKGEVRGDEAYHTQVSGGYGYTQVALTQVTLRLHSGYTQVTHLETKLTTAVGLVSSFTRSTFPLHILSTWARARVRVTERVRVQVRTDKRHPPPNLPTSQPPNISPNDPTQPTMAWIFIIRQFYVIIQRTDQVR